jgi:hypothetical protein
VAGSGETTDTTLSIERLDGGELVLAGLGLAHEFFTRDPSSVGVVGVDLPWLAAATAELDLIETSEQTWNEVGGERVVAALSAACGPGRGVSVATKMLHLKRPRLLPVLDELVVQVLGRSIPEAPERRAAAAIPILLHLREQGRPTSPSSNPSGGRSRPMESSGPLFASWTPFSGPLIREAASTAFSGRSRFASTSSAGVAFRAGPPPPAATDGRT